MNLLHLPDDVWTSYVMPLVGLSDMVRLTGCSRASGNLTRQAMERDPSIAVVAPSDMYACLTWLKNNGISVGQLVIDHCHEPALLTARHPQFSACFREIVLKFLEGGTVITGIYDNTTLLLLHEKLVVLEIEAPAVVSNTLMCYCGCQNLHSIIYMIKFREDIFSERWLTKMIIENPKLKKLHVGQYDFFSEDVFAAIAERQESLTDMAMWVGRSREANEHDQLRRLLESCPSLRKLTFGAYGWAGDYGYGLVGMENKCPHLEELVLENMKFSGDSLTEFILSCPKLRVCHADEGSIADHDLVRWHRQGGPKLHDFGLLWAVEQLDTVVACAALFEEVRTYHMHCSVSWQTAAEALAYMPRLHTVCLYWHPVKILPYLPRYCPQLRVLRLLRYERLKYCKEIGATLIAALSGLTKLEELQWRLISGFGDAGLMALAQHCPNLRSLDCECLSVTDAGLIALVRGCPAQRTLLLKYRGKDCLTDAFLHAIAQHCPHLEKLRLPSLGYTASSPFSHAAVTEVLAACTHLRVLHVPRNLKDDVQASTLVLPAGRLRKLTIRVV